jgi:hypothetical protein
LVLRSTAISWRRVRISTSLDDDARLSSVSQPGSQMKIRCRRRIDPADNHPLRLDRRSTQVAGSAHFWNQPHATRPPPMAGPTDSRCPGLPRFGPVRPAAGVHREGFAKRHENAALAELRSDAHAVIALALATLLVRTVGPYRATAHRCWGSTGARCGRQQLVDLVSRHWGSEVPSLTGVAAQGAQQLDLCGGFYAFDRHPQPH